MELISYEEYLGPLAEWVEARRQNEDGQYIGDDGTIWPCAHFSIWFHEWMKYTISEKSIETGFRNFR